MFIFGFLVLHLFANVSARILEQYQSFYERCIESRMDKDETAFLAETPVPKTIQEDSPITPSSSYITSISSSSNEDANIYDSSELNFSIMYHFRSPSLETPHLPTTPSLFIQSSHFSSSSTKNIAEEDYILISHQKSKDITNSEDISSLYLLNHSSYLLEDLLYDSRINKLLEDSYYVTKDSLLDFRSSSEKYFSPSVTETNVFASSITDSNSYNIEEVHSNVISSNVDTFRPVAESRIHIISSLNTPQLSTSFHLEEISTNTDFSSILDGLRIVEVSNTDATTEISKSEVSELFEFPKEDISLDYSENTQPIESLEASISSFNLGIQSISTAGSSKSKTQITSSTVITEQPSNKSILDRDVSTNNTNISSYSLLTIPDGEDLKKANVTHEIINDFNQPKNKTSRNEEPHLDDIISGIVHLLAGNVQLGRPGPNLFPTAPKRQNRPSPLHSTRINNRGPLSSATFSRTVVVFSQPHNPGNIAPDRARPVQFAPSTTNGGMLSRPSDKNMQFIRIQPTRVGEKPPPGISVIRFYHPGGKVPANNHGQPPFIGEIFTHNGVPLNPNLHLTNIPEGAFLNSLTDQIKMQNKKEKSEQSHPHFIFSDASGSSVLVVLPSLPSNIQTVGTINKNTVIPTETTKIKPSKTFEVLADTSNPQKGIPNVKPSNITHLKPSKDSGFKESSSGVNVKPTSVLNDSPLIKNHTVPFGPVTDWVPFLERPSMQFKPPNVSKTLLDEVSIIMQPIIFDITVSNSLNEIKISDNRTYENKSSKSLSKHNERTSQSYLESSNLNTFTTTESKTPTYEITNSQNILTEKHLSPSDENIIVMTPTTSIHKSEGIFTLQKLRTTLGKDESKIQKQTSTMKTDLTSSITSSQTLASKKAEDNLRLQNSYRTTLSLNTISSRTLGSVSSRTLNSVSSRTFGAPPSPHSNIHSPLGRPIVIPVDIEEVRPFVGAINPINQDKSRGMYPSYGGTYPYPPVQVTRAGVNAREDFSASSSTSPFQTSRTPIIRSQARPRPNTIRIDTCIVGDDSTCDSKVNETCKTEFGISSCHCRPGYARSYTRGPCIPVVSIGLSLKIDRLGSRKISFSPKYLDKNSEEYRIMEFEAKQALTSLFSHTAFSRIFFGANVNLFYTIAGKLIVNSTVFLEEKESTRAQSVRLRLRQEIGEAIKKRNQNIGESRLYVEGPLSPIINIEDVNECSDPNLNDCSQDGACLNVFGTFLCKCRAGYVDPLKHIERRGGRQCLACSPEYCTYHGQCFVERDQKLCKCQGNYIGSRCEIDGEVLGVALGASLAAIIIILLTLSCLCIWNRKWKKQQQKAEVLSARSYNSNQTFSYLSNMMNANANANPYQLTMEDRMRWAHISDVVKNATMPNQECVNPYASTTLEQASFPNRYQHPNDKDPSWYDYRTRPRSRMLSHTGASPNTTYYEMDSPARGPYMTSSCHSTKRFHNPNKMLRY